MRYLIPFVFLLAACKNPTADTADTEKPRATVTIVGQLEDPRIDEASGLAVSGRDANTLWVINDDGKPRIHAIDHSGKRLGEVEIEDAKNKDWEDLASFTLDGEPYLLIADIGDNDAKRDTRQLYIVAEPSPDDESVPLAWKIRYRYPQGPRDVESLAVIPSENRILLLSKRDIPPVLYELPLRVSDEKTTTATRLGEITSLPQPDTAPFKMPKWSWQPTSMDISSDNRTAIVLTYLGAYRFSRAAGQSWYEALSSGPTASAHLNGLPGAESIALSNDNQSAFFTIEQVNAPLLQITFNGATTP